MLSLGSQGGGYVISGLRAGNKNLQASWDSVSGACNKVRIAGCGVSSLGAGLSSIHVPVARSVSLCCSCCPSCQPAASCQGSRVAPEQFSDRQHCDEHDPVSASK